MPDVIGYTELEGSGSYKNERYSWWYTLTRRDKLMLFIISFLVCIIIALCAALAINDRKHKDITTPSPNVSTTVTTEPTETTVSSSSETTPSKETTTPEVTTSIETSTETTTNDITTTIETTSPSETNNETPIEISSTIVTNIEENEAAPEVTTILETSTNDEINLEPSENA